MIEKMEIQKEHFLNRVNRRSKRERKFQAGIHIGQYLNKTLVGAEDEAKLIWAMSMCL